MTAAVRFQASLDRLVVHADRDVRLQAARCVGQLPGAAGIARMRELAQDVDPEVRLEALRALAERRSELARPALRRAFQDDADLACRRAALVGLVALDDRAMLPTLRRLVRNPDAFIYEQSPATQASRQALCCEAVAALGMLGDATVVPDLLHLLDRHVSPTLDAAVIRALARLGEPGREALEALAGRADARRARDAVQALAESADTREVEALAMFLGHADGSVRLAAAQALVRLAPSHSALLRRADDPEPVLRALVARHAGPTMPAVLELMLDDVASMVACAALQALPDVPPARRSPDLIWHVRGKLRHADDAIAQAAAGALVALDPEAALTELSARIADRALPVGSRLAAARGLAALGNEAAFERLVEQVVGAEPDLRTGVLRALADLATEPQHGPRVHGFLIELLQPIARSSSSGLAEASSRYGQALDVEGDRDVLRVRIEVAGLLAERPSQAVEAVLAEVVATAPDVALRTAAATALAQVGERLGRCQPTTLRVARDLLHAEDPALRLAGLRLATVMPGRADPPVVETCLDDRDPSIRARALSWLAKSPSNPSPSLSARVAAALDDGNASVRLAAIGAALRPNSGISVANVIEAIVRHGDEAVPSVAQQLGALPAERVHNELARLLAMATSRKRQLALLRLSASVLTHHGAALHA